MNGKKRLLNGVTRRYQYYVCPKRNDYNCGCPNIRKDHIDKNIIETIFLNVVNKRVITEIISEIKDKISFELQIKNYMTY